MAKKIWNIGTRSDSAEVMNIAKTLGVSMPTANLLYNRGYVTPADASSFIRLETELFHDPFLMTDMKKAAERIVTAMEKGERIAIYGDYDVDGVSSTCLLSLYFRDNGIETVFHIPNRVGEGYGVNRDAIDKLVSEGTNLIITVDTGITAVEEAEYCRSLGCDMVITDHHECRGDIPRAIAVVNPHRPDCSYPFKELAGVGVAFKLVTAVEMLLRQRRGMSTDGFLTDICKKFVDLAALGTVADVMPLVGENRLIVSMGLSYMERSPRPGLSALLDAVDAGKAPTKKRKMTSSVIGFTVAPRINAAGRMASASRAAELFLSRNTDEIREIAEELCQTNTQRQNEENKIVDSLKERIEAELALGSPVIVLDDTGWKHGVIGIVSSRITEKYGKPSIIISFEDGIGKGSGRSVKGMNLVEALLHCSDLLEKFGGHELAAGLTIKEENLSAFKIKLNEYAKEALGGEASVPTLELDFELSPSEMTLTQAEELDLIEPCGVGNPQPSFYCPSLTVLEVTSMGQGRHTKYLLDGNGKRISSVYFGSSPEELGFSPSDKVDIAFKLGVNEFRGVRSEQILLRDIRRADEQSVEREKEYDGYMSILDGVTPANEELPVRADFVSTYLHLKRSTPDNGVEVSLRSLLHSLKPINGGEMSYIKLRLVLDVLNESGVIILGKEEGEKGSESIRIRVPHIETKVDLEKSCIYKRLAKQ
ncbi:MAG: single-stranded-DNA-specific exonuclease RecJ [Clostridia bacterium]|nr:single-stranded-DNA-specific exonuclease RecJ [Clostridia bacterium]